ncbi:MAG: hypothetical protein V3V78_02335 [Candidatus Woesearchaeota archaeon]
MVNITTNTTAIGNIDAVIIATPLWLKLIIAILITILFYWYQKKEPEWMQNSMKWIKKNVGTFLMGILVFSTVLGLFMMLDDISVGESLALIIMPAIMGSVTLKNYKEEGKWFLLSSALLMIGWFLTPITAITPNTWLLIFFISFLEIISAFSILIGALSFVGSLSSLIIKLLKN